MTRVIAVALVAFVVGCGGTGAVVAQPDGGADADPELDADAGDSVGWDVGQDTAADATTDPAAPDAIPAEADAGDAGQGLDSAEAGDAAELQDEAGDAAQDLDPEPSPEAGLDALTDPAVDAWQDATGVDATGDALELQDALIDPAVDAVDAAQEAEAGPPACPASMVRLPAGFCIDRAEVTNAAWAAWLATAPALDADLACSWNASFVPAQGWPVSSSAAQRPVAWVDWCDARAYCKTHGKRLCGRIGGGALPWDILTITDPGQSEWQNACTSAGAHVYTWGNAGPSGQCNAKLGLPATWAAGSHPSCQSPDPAFAGVLDLTGNVWEWEDGCTGTAGAWDQCRARGSAFQGTGDPRCGTADGVGIMTAARAVADAAIGVRCCAD